MLSYGKNPSVRIKQINNSHIIPSKNDVVLILILAWSHSGSESTKGTSLEKHYIQK